MISEAVLGNIYDNAPDDGRLSVPVPFEWFEASKRRLRKTAEDGTDVCVVNAGTLRDGDILAETDDKRYVVAMRTAQLIEIPVHTMKEMGRLCFELGNRHLSLKVEDDRVLVPYDHPTMEYTTKIGFEPHIIEGGFDGFLIVKAHAGSGTIVPGTGKTTGDLEEAEQEASAPERPQAHRHEPPAGVLHRADGMHSHDGGRTWHAH